MADLLLQLKPTQGMVAVDEFLGRFWVAWIRRNKSLFEEGFVDGDVLRIGLLRLISDYKGAKFSRSISPHQPVSHSWVMPGVGLVKINVDAGFFNGQTGFGAVGRDANGVLLFVAAKCHQGSQALSLAEALCIKWAL